MSKVAELTLTVLGCGSSGGVPTASGYKGSCDLSEPKNWRLRTSLCIKQGDRCWLIDTSPDLRAQALANGITTIHGVLYSHGHYDHIGGFDELKTFSYSTKTPIPVWCDQATGDTLRACFGYGICPKGPYAPFVSMNPLEPSFSCMGLKVRTFPQDHGHGIVSWGFHFGSFCYSTDVQSLSQESLELIKGVPLWFVDATGYHPRGGHAPLQRVLEWITYVQPERAILIHLGTAMDYPTLKRSLPSGVEPAYDGMEIRVPLI